MAIRRLTARNDATESENRIHADAVARRFGFLGGLVPGVAVIAYAVGAVVDELGDGWLDGGCLDVRLVAPVYDGDQVTAACRGGEVTVVTAAGTSAVGTAASGAATSDTGDDPGSTPPRAEPPRPRPPASTESLAPGSPLATLTHVADADDVARYLAAIGDDPAPWSDRRIVHPGWLLRDANHTLAAAVRLGPWIHASSRMSVLGRARPGDEIETTAVVLAEREHKGHRLVELDVLTRAAGAPVLRVHHTAIWRPRQVTDDR